MDLGASGALTITGPGSKSFDILVVAGGGSGGAGPGGNYQVEVEEAVSHTYL